MNRIFVSVLAIWISSVAAADELPIFDAHIHYSHDAVSRFSPAEAAQILREAGVGKALVSSSDDDGTQKLRQAAPEIVVPALRPYRRRGEINTWMHDPTVIDYLTDRLNRYDYAAIGEFHANGADIQTPVVQKMIALAREHNLLLHVHGDREALDRIFETWPGARVLWAHAGFEEPENVAQALETHARLWADLAFRSDVAAGGRIDGDWKKVFLAYPDRFVLGTDTFAPDRWNAVGPNAAFSRQWLADLPHETAHKIAFDNASDMLAGE